MKILDVEGVECIGKMDAVEVHTSDRPFLCQQCDNSLRAPNQGLQVQVIVDTGAKEVQCDMCKKKFSQASNLAGHIVVHKNEKPYQCDRCNLYFETPSALKSHMDVHVQDKKRVVCEICNKSFSSNGNLVKHQRLHETSKPFPCEICKKSYASESYLKAHMWTHVDNKPFECEICRKSFSQYNHLKRHLQIHAFVKPHVCNICNKSFPTNGNLKRHKQTHVLYECQVCGKRFRKLKKLQDHLTDHVEDKPFRCETCEVGFLTKEKLKAHMWVHTRDKTPFSCSICKEKFPFARNLKKHRLEVHGEKHLKKSNTNYQEDVDDPDEDFTVPVEDDLPEKITYVYDPDKRYECEVCKKTFKSQRIKTEHVMRLHDGIKPYSCKTCGMKFGSKSNLKRHTKIHNQGNPFACTVCDRSYKTMGALKSHMWEHNDIKPYECSVCQKKFSQVVHLKRHMIIHTEDKKHKCDLCGMSFAQSGNLKRHRQSHVVKYKGKCGLCDKRFQTSAQLKMHYNEEHDTTKQFRCRLCHRQFTTERILKGHMWSHAEKPFTCKKCDKRFASRFLLKRHMNVHQETAYKCEICNRSFLRLGNYKSHMSLHQTGATRKCVVCEISFSTNRLLDRHMKDNHPDSKTFKCDFCEESFHTTYYRSKHVDTQHSDKQKEAYSCVKCNKYFCSSDALTAHQREHGIEDPFKCNVCHKSFPTKLRQQLHMRIHRGIFYCRYCKSVFASLEEKKDHLKCMTDSAHKPFHCETCDKLFSCKQKLARHQLIHTGARPFVCTICDKGFTQAAHLKDHNRLHTGEKPYQCQKCLRRFTHSRSHKLHEDKCQGPYEDCPCRCVKNNKPHKAFQCDHCQQFFRFERNLNTHKKNLECNHELEGEADEHMSEQSGNVKQNPNVIGNKEHVEPEEIAITVTESDKFQQASSESEMSPPVQNVNMESTMKLVETILEAAEARSSLEPSQERLQCVQCKKTFSDRCGLSSHMQESHPDLIKSSKLTIKPVELMKTEASDLVEIASQTISEIACQTDFPQSATAKLVPNPSYRILYVGPNGEQSEVENMSHELLNTDPTSIGSSTVQPETIEANNSVQQLIEAATWSERSLAHNGATTSIESEVLSIEGETTGEVLSLLSAPEYISEVDLNALTVVTGDESSGIAETFVLDSIPADAVRIIATRPDDDNDTIIIKIEYDE